MYVVYESPFQMVSDTPAAYEDQPAFEFIKHAPATWDETKVLGGHPGEFITIARRSGDTWFLGSMTNWSPRPLEETIVDCARSLLGQGARTVAAGAP